MPTRRCVHCGSEALEYSEDKQGFGVGKALVGAVVFGPLGLLAGGINRNKRTVYVRCNSCFKIYSAMDLLKAESKPFTVQVKCSCGTKYNNSHRTCPNCGRSTSRNLVVGYIIMAVVLAGIGACAVRCF